MSELTTYNLSLFNKYLLKFRIKYYFKETGELLLRHKLLLVFLFCLLAPGFENISLIGVPFSVIVAPDWSLTVKSLSLIALLSFLCLFIKAQTNSIKGGEFGYYLAIQIFSSQEKRIDLVILLLALNIIWVALFFGAMELSNITHNTSLLYSYYALYSSLIIAVIIFLLNVLYKNIKNAACVIFLCMLIALVSRQQSCLLNLSVALFSVLSCIIIGRQIQPYTQKIQIFNTNKKRFKKTITKPSIKIYFLTQLATMRAHRLAFIIRISLCVLLTITIINSAPVELFENMLVVLLSLIAIQTYILSTVATFFQKNEQDYNLFHFIFHDNLLIKRGVEILCIFAGLFLSLLPLIVFIAFMKPDYVVLLTGIIITSILTITINRILYMYSLRFCFFTSLINTVANVVMQYLLIGVFFGK